MKSNSIKAFAFSFALLGAVNSIGQTNAVTDPVGFVSVTVPANSDAILAVPMNRASVYKGVINSISGTTITVAGISPAWGNNQFVQALPTQINTYAVQFASGVKEGMIGKVTGNTANTVTISLESGDDLTGVKTETVDGAGLGDHIDIMPYWTPATVISAPADGTEIYNYFNTSGNPGVGSNLSPATLLVYNAGVTSWVDQISEDDVSHVPLKFGSAFLLRNNSTQQTFSVVGAVPMTAHRFLVKTLANNSDQDLRLGYSSPIPETVASLGIPAQTGDQIFVFDNSAPGKNKSPAKILVYSGTEWVDSVSEAPEGGYVIQPANGFIFRKFRTVSPATVVWQDLPGYLN